MWLKSQFGILVVFIVNCTKPSYVADSSGWTGKCTKWNETYRSLASSGCYKKVKPHIGSFDSMCVGKIKVKS